MRLFKTGEANESLRTALNLGEQDLSSSRAEMAKQVLDDSQLDFYSDNSKL